MIPIKANKKLFLRLIGFATAILIAIALPFGINAETEGTESTVPPQTDSKREDDTTSAVIAFLIAVVTVSSVVMLIKILDPRDRK